MEINNKFQVHKALQILYYLQSKANNATEKYYYLYLLKLFFFADRFHIRHYGFPIIDTRYMAQKLGPVSSELCDLLKKTNWLQVSETEKKEIEKNIKKISENERTILPQSQDLLSESNIEALDFAIKNFSKLDRWTLSDITHDYPEWKSSREDGDMDYLDFFKNVDVENTKYLSRHFKSDPFEMDEDELNFNKNQFENFHNAF